VSALEEAFEDMKELMCKGASLQTLDGFDSELVALCEKDSLHLYQSYGEGCIVNNILLLEECFPQLIKRMQERLNDNRNS
jgi:hypothetical protein